jgi:uncharacterized protein (DUF1800 family)
MKMQSKTMAAMLLVACLVLVACGGGGDGGGPVGPTALVIATQSLPAGTTTAGYSATVVASGGTAPYSFVLTAGDFPGVSISQTGTLTGNPLAVGVHQFTLSVTDSATPPATASRAFSVSVTAGTGGTALSITTTTMNPATLNSPYTALIIAQGGTAPRAFSVTAGGAPGMNLSSNGLFSGTPSIQGSFNFTVRVTDASFPQQVATRDFTLVVNPIGGGGGGALTITTATISNGKEGDNYTQSFAATGGIQPYSFSQTGEAVPGLSLTTAGVLSGTPTIDGSFNYQVTVTDSASPAATFAMTYTLVVAPLSAAELLAQQPTFTVADAAHLLGRYRWGTAPGEDVNAATTGLVAYVDQLLNVTTDSQIENQALLDRVPDPLFPNNNQVAEWWLQLMVRTNNPMQETMALFWHDLFATSLEVLPIEGNRYMINHVNMLRRNSLGNLRTFVKELCVDDAVLEWLDGVRSTRNAPNENFARELWELFTLGADNGYTQADIEEASKCFTGFRRRVDTTGTITGGVNLWYNEFDPNRHNITNKTIFGQTIIGKTGMAGLQEFDEVVDITFDHRPVAEFFVTRLWEYFCYDNPEPEVVDLLAAQLRAANYEVKPVIRTILLSRAFYSDRARGSNLRPNGGVVKTPTEFAVGLIRATGIEPTFPTLRASLFNAGHLPTRPPNVNGWPKGELWASADGLVTRANLARDLIVARNHQNNNGMNLDGLLPPLGSRTDSAVVDRMASAFGINMTISERNRYLEYLNSDRNAQGQVISSPFNGDNATEIDKKVRGLIYIMSQHPSFHIR